MPLRSSLQTCVQYQPRYHLFNRCRPGGFRAGILYSRCPFREKTLEQLPDPNLQFIHIGQSSHLFMLRSVPLLYRLGLLWWHTCINKTAFAFMHLPLLCTIGSCVVSQDSLALHWLPCTGQWCVVGVLLHHWQYYVLAGHTLQVGSRSLQPLWGPEVHIIIFLQRALA